MEERLAKVEIQLNNVAADMVEVKEALKSIAKSLSTLAVLEEKHNTVTDALKRAFIHIERNEERIGAIEKVMPVVVLTSGWVFKAVLAVMGILGAAAITTIMTR